MNFQYVLSIIHFYHFFLRRSAFLPVFLNGIIYSVHIIGSGIAHYLSDSKRLFLWRISDCRVWINESKFPLIEGKKENVAQWGIWCFGDIGSFKYPRTRFMRYIGFPSTKSHSNCFFYVIVKVTKSSGNAEACRFETLPNVVPAAFAFRRVPHYACLPNRCFTARKQLSDFRGNVKSLAVISRFVRENKSHKFVNKQRKSMERLELAWQEANKKYVACIFRGICLNNLPVRQ